LPVNNPDMIASIAPFLAGLGLFFCGVHLISVNLAPLAGRKFRSTLMRLSGRPALAALTGVVAGMVTQSANAVTFIVIGLVGGGIVDKRRAILVPTWSHVGTSVLVMLVAVDFRVAASYAVAIAGFAVYFGYDNGERAQHGVNTLLGAGLLFLGMGMLSSGSGQLPDLLVSGGVVQFVAGTPILLLILGAVLSFICLSSTIASAIAVAAVTVGLIDFAGACWLVYGANLGSAGNHYVLAMTMHGDTRQIALMQVVQKLAGFLGVMAIVVAGAIAGKPMLENMVSTITATPSGKLAWVFLLYQVVGALICTLTIDPAMKLLGRLAPTTKLEELSKPAYLINQALIEPALALDLVVREEHRLLAHLPAMLDIIREGGSPSVPPATLRAVGKNITRAMSAYLESVLNANAERADRERVIALQHRTANLDALYEAVGEFETAARSGQGWPASRRVADSMIEALHALLSALADAVGSSDPSDRDFIQSLLGDRDEMMQRMRQRVLREDPNIPMGAQEAIFTATVLFERIVWLARRTTLLLERESPEPAPAEPAPAEQG
jgi:phosphate:Na+ symporter